MLVKGVNFSVSDSVSQYQATGRNPATRRNQDVLESDNLIDRAATHLTDRFGDAVHAVDIGLTNLPAVGIDREAAADFNVAVPYKILCFATIAKAAGFKRGKYGRSEVVVDDGGVHVLCRRPPMA